MSKTKIPPTELVDIDSIFSNEKNPRIIRDKKFIDLCKSIKDFPEMRSLRPIIVNKEGVILGGNMRHKGEREVGNKTVYIIRALHFTKAQEEEFIIKDNLGFGEWDWEILANEWDQNLLVEWGMDLPKESGENADQSDVTPLQEFYLNVKCRDENHAKELYQHFHGEGLEVKIIT